MRIFLCYILLLPSLLGLAAPSGYLYYKKLSTQEIQISVNSNSINSFPLLINITDADLKSINNGGKVRSSKGFDIIFTASDGTTLIPFQLENYDSLTGKLVAWVKIPTLSATVNTDLYMYFGNPNANVNLGVKSTWDANYKAVYHLNADVADWTSNAANLTNTGTTNLSPGIAADGQRIGTGTYLSRAATAGLQITGDLTLEAWMIPNSLLGGSNENIVLSSSSSSDGTAATNINYCLSISGSGGNLGTLIFKWQYANNSDESVSSTAPISSTVAGWHYVSVVRDATAKQVRFYLDGNQLGTAVSYSNQPTGGSSNSFLIGKNLADAGRSIDAGFDELRISNIIRNPEWIQASYQNYKPGSTFITYSSTFPILQNSFCSCSIDMTGYTLLGTFNSHTYYASNKKTNWQRADSLASSLGGHLVSINSLLENTFLATNYLNRAWIGLSDSITEGSFLWTTGESVTYTNWSVLQPDNSGNSDYALFNTIGVGLWDDLQNSSQFFIVEFDCTAPSPLVVNAGTDQSVCGNAANLTASPLPVSAFGSWALLSGSGTITSSSSASTTVTGLGTGINSFIWKAGSPTCSANVDTVIISTDTVKPTITCSGDITISNTPGLCTGVASWSTPTVSDNCSSPTLSQTAGLASGSAFPLGTNTVSYMLSDSNGNSATCSFNVTVVDNEIPQITCPGNVSVNSDASACGAVVKSIAPTVASDNCSGYTITYVIGGATSASGVNDVSGTFFNVGVSQVRYIITDSKGNSTACNFFITVTDNTPPSFTYCPSDITTNVDASSCTAQVTWIEPTAIDNCPGVNVVQVSGLPSGSDFPIGTTGIKYSVTDAAGQASICTFNITVVDNIRPDIISCPSDITVSNTPGFCSGIATWISPTVSDNCSGSTISQTDGLASGSAFPIGTTTITYKAIDAAGLSNICSFTVTVLDATAPTIINCPSNINLSNSTGQCNATVNWVSPSVSDNCTGATISQISGPVNGSVFPIGTTPVSYQAIDAAGNITLCSFNVTVTDNELPITQCPANVSVPNDVGVCTALVNGIAPTNTSDNCPGNVVTYTISGATTANGVNDASGTVFNLGTSLVTYTSKDAVGNKSNCSFTVIVSPPIPTISNAGPSQIICNSTSTMAANTPLVGTGVWTIVSGFAVINSVNSPTTTISGLAVGTTVLRWTISTSPCTASFSDVSITVDNTPSPALAGSDQTNLCGINSASLSANTPITGTGSWSVISGAGGSFIAGNNPTTVFNGSLGVSYILRWTISNGSCSSNTDDVNITFNNNPTIANAGTDQTSLCGLTSTALTANTPTVGTGAWSIVSGAGGSFTLNTDPVTTFTGTLGTTYILRWTIANAPCTSSSDDVIITFNNNPTIANAGVDQTSPCGVTSITLAANTPTAGTGSWSIISGAGGAVTTSSSATSAFTGTLGTTYVLRWTIANAPCASSTDDVTITFNNNPTTANAGADQTSLCGVTSTTLAANTPTVGTGSWSIISGAGGAVNTPSSATSAFDGTLGTTYVLRWTIANPPCTSSTDDVTITFNNNPTTANAGVDQTNLCGVTSTTLAANTPTVGTGIWSIVSGAGGAVTTPSNATSAFTGILGTNYVLRWTIANAPCISSTDDVTISFNNNPTTANAGSDQTGSATCGLTSVTLQGNTASFGVGTWSIISGGSGVFSNSNLGNSTFSGAANTMYVLRWTISNSCSSNSDEVNVLFNQNPTVANAGSDQTLSCGSISTALSANNPIIGIGSWSITSGVGGSFANAASPTTSFSGLLSNSASITYTLTWTIGNGVCNSSSDQVEITLPQAAVAANAGNDQTGNCGATLATLNALLPAGFTGLWSIVNGTGGSFGASNNPASTFVGISGSTYTLRWTISRTSNGCSSFDDVVVYFPPGSTIANAGPDQTSASTCGLTSVSLAANNPFVGIGHWSIVNGLGGSFGDTLNPTSSFNGLAGVTYTLRWTISNLPCTSSSDDVVISFNSSPSSSLAGSDQNLCGTNSTTLSANTPTIGAGNWTILSGTGGIVASATNPASSFTGVLGNSYVLRWTISNNPCTASSDDVVITFNQNPTPSNAGTNQSICGNSTTLAANIPTFGSGIWTVIAGAASFSNVSSANSVVSGLSIGNNTLRWTISTTNCGSSFSEVTVISTNNTTTANAGTDQLALCGINSTTLSANVPTSGSGIWSVISGTGGSLSSASNPLSGFTGVLGNNYVLRWTISNAPCVTSFDDVSIVFNSQPSSANAGINQNICANSTNLSGNIPSSGSGNWSLISGSGILANPNSPNSSVSGLAVGSSVFRWTISTTSCGSSTADVTIFVTSNPSNSFAGTDQVICSSTATLNATVPIIGTGQWSTISGSASIQTSNAPASAVSGLLTGTTVFQWTVSNGICPNSTSTVSITVNQNPSTANAGNDQIICGNSTALSANPATIGNGSWSVITGSGSFTNPNLENTLVSGLSAGVNVFRWTVSNPPCNSSFDEVTINVSSIPAIADAGPNQLAICGINSTTLASNAVSSGNSAIWSIVNGTGGTLITPTSSSTQFTGLYDSTYVLRWTISSPGCSDSFDDVVIHFNNLPTSANAGTDQHNCESSSTIFLAANQPLIGSGIWTVFAGTGTFATTSLETTGVSGLSLGNNQFVWTISNVCGSSSDTVNAVVDASPLSAFAGSDQQVCISNPLVNLFANAAPLGIGQWAVVSGSGNFSNTNLETATVTGLAQGFNSYTWTINNGACLGVSDTVIIEVQNLPTQAALGNDTSICASSIALNGNTSIVGLGNWTVVTGSGQLLNPNSANTSASALSSGVNSFAWTITNGSCSSSSDTLVVTVSDSPSISIAGANQLICADSTFLNANAPLIGNGIWSLVAGSGTITNPNNPTTKITGLSSANSTFRWTISNGTCSPSSSDVTVSINPSTSNADAGPDQIICGNSSGFAGNSPAIGSGIWTLISGSGNILNPNSPTSLVNGLGLGLNKFEWRISNPPCSDSFDTLSITVTSIPALANAGSDQTNLCSITSTLLNADTTNQSNGSWSIMAGNGGSFSSIFSPNANFNGLPDSTYILRWTITDFICSSSFDDVIIHFNSPPTLANAGLDQVDASTCGLNSISLTANTPLNGSGFWSVYSGAGGSFSNNSPTSLFTGISGVHYSLIWTLSNVCGSSSDTVNITLNQLNSTANAGLDEFVCESASSITLAALAPVSGTGNWSINSGTGTFSNQTSENAILTGFSIGLNTYVWSVSNGICQSTSDTILVQVEALPSIAYAGTDLNGCEGAPYYVIHADSALIGTGSWSSLSPGITIGNYLASSTLVSGLSLGTSTLVWSIASGNNCPASSDTVLLTINPLPTLAFAGNDAAICESNSSINLSANQALIGSGSWSAISGSPSFNAGNSATTSVTNLTIGANLLVWTITTNSCGSSSDTVAITVNSLPNAANAGLDQQICESTTSISLNANVPNLGIGLWAVLSGSVVFSDSSLASSLISNLGLGQNTLSWTITNGACSTSDTLVIGVDAQPSIANAGLDKNSCTPFTLLKADTALVGSGLWTLAPGSSGTILNPNFDTTAVLGMSVGTNSFIWTISNGVCPNSSDTVNIEVNQGATNSSAGPDQTVCANIDSVTLSANIPSFGVGHWMLISGQGTISDSTLTNTSVKSLGLGVNIFAWIIKNGLCSSSDAVKITVDALPSVSIAGQDQTICSTSSLLNANAPNVGTGLWSVASGSGTFANAASPTSSVNGLALGLNTFVWTISNGICSSSSDTLTIEVSSAQNVANAGTDQAVCISNASVNLAANNAGSGIGTWTVYAGTANVVNPNSENTAVNSLSIGLNSFIWTVTNGVCADSKDTVSIQVDNLPSVAAVGANQQLCENVGIITISANAPTLGIGNWSVVQGSGLVVNPNNSTTTSSFSRGVNLFVWTIENGSCPNSKDTALVLIDSLAQIAFAGNDQVVCENVAILNLNATDVLYGQAYWTSLSGGALVSNPNAGNSSVTGLSIGQNQFVWTTSNALCPSNSDTVKILLDKLPTIALAGPDQNICDTSSQIQLAGNAAQSGIGVWNNILGAGIIAQPSDSASFVSGLVTGTSTFEWVISNGVCASSRDTILVFINESPTVPNAGSNQIICENTSSAQLLGSTPLIGTGEWSLISGTAILSNSLIVNPTITAIGLGINKFKWTITNGLCQQSDTVLVQVDELPSVANAGTDISVGAPFANLEAAAPAVGNGVWSFVQGSGSFVDETNSTTQVNALSVGTSILTWTITNGVCPANSDELNIIYQDLQIPNAISPNNDGINDAFVIPGLVFYSGVKFTLFNSWGSVVYQNNDYKNEFVGENNSGQRLLDDTYYYILQIASNLEYKGYLIIKK